MADMPELTPEQIKAALAMAAAHARRARRPMTSKEGATMAHRVQIQRALARMRPVRWPKNDPLVGADVCFILNVTPQSFAQACAAGRLPATLEGRRYYVKQKDLRAYLRSTVEEGKRLGLDIPPAAAATVLRLPR